MTAVKNVEFRGRSECLLELVEFPASLNEAKVRLSQYAWESEQELVLLRPEHVISVLQRFVRKEISAAEVEDWANLIEGREDIGLEARSEEMCSAAMHELANPLLTRQLTSESATEWIQWLERAK